MVFVVNLVRFSWQEIGAISMCVAGDRCFGLGGLHMNFGDVDCRRVGPREGRFVLASRTCLWKIFGREHWLSCGR